MYAYAYAHSQKDKLGRWICCVCVCVLCVCAPESEDEKHQQHAESGHIVHGLHQHYQLSPQGGQEANQLQNPQQTKCSQHRQPTV